MSVPSAEHALLPGVCTPSSPEPVPGRWGLPRNPANLSPARKRSVLCPCFALSSAVKPVESATRVAVFICLVLSEWKVREGWISFSLLVTLCPQRLKGAWHVIGLINICGRKERRENFKQ